MTGPLRGHRHRRVSFPFAFPYFPVVRRRGRARAPLGRGGGILPRSCCAGVVSLLCGAGFGGTVGGEWGVRGFVGGGLDVKGERDSRFG